MRTFNKFITEKLKLGKNVQINKYNFYPDSKEELKKILDDKITKHTNHQNILDLNDIDVSNIDDMSNLFYKNFDIVNIDISEWNMINVNNCQAMFSYCRYLRTTGDLGKWNINNIENMSYMFLDCTNLINIGDLSKWDVSNVTDMRSMFSGTKRLKTLGDIKNWNMPNPVWEVFPFSMVEPTPYRHP